MWKANFRRIGYYTDELVHVNVFPTGRRFVLQIALYDRGAGVKFRRANRGRRGVAPSWKILYIECCLRATIVAREGRLEGVQLGAAAVGAEGQRFRRRFGA